MTNKTLTESVEKFFAWLGFISMTQIVNLLWAWPLMWTWNYVMPFMFGLPILTWGKAWCIQFVAVSLIKSHLVENKNR